MQVWMLAAAAVLFIAAAFHFGAFGAGHAHERARIPETVIGVVLAAGALAATIPGWGVAVAWAALVFGILGVLLGIVLVAVGVGPRSSLDYVLHAVMVVFLAAAAVSAWQAGAIPPPSALALFQPGPSRI